MGIFDYIRKDGSPLVELDESVDTKNLKSIKGRVTKVDPKGYGFITSEALPFERIFFHWTSLKHDTLNFKKLLRGAIVEFIPIKGTDNVTKIESIRAIKISVIKNGKSI